MALSFSFFMYLSHPEVLYGFCKKSYNVKYISFFLNLIDKFV